MEIKKIIGKITLEKIGCSCAKQESDNLHFQTAMEQQIAAFDICVRHLKSLLNNEPNDKRSVATEDDSSNADGKQAIDFGKFLTKNGYELYGDGWALQKGKKCGRTNEQLYEQFKAQLAEQKK